MAKITKASLEQAALEMAAFEEGAHILTDEEKQTIVAGRYGAYTSFGMSDNQHEAHTLAGLETDLLSTQVGREEQNQPIGCSTLPCSSQPEQTHSPFITIHEMMPDDASGSFEGSGFIEHCPSLRPGHQSGYFGEEEDDSDEDEGISVGSGYYYNPSHSSNKKKEKFHLDVDYKKKTDQNKLSQKTCGALSAACEKIGEHDIIITRTAATPHEQAVAMYQNIVKYGTAYEKGVYGAAGDHVIDTYDKKKNATENISRMEREIMNQGPDKVSHHCADFKKRNVFDIALSSVANPSKLVQELQKQGCSAMIENNCIHVEYDQ